MRGSTDVPKPMTLNAENAFVGFRAQLGRYISRRIGASDEVQDVLQDVFLRVVRNEKALQQADRPLAWLHSVARSAVVDHLRKKARIPAGQEMEIETIAAAPPSDAEFDRCLWAILKNLPDIYREALEFIDIKGGKQREYAQASRISLAAAKSRILRGRRMLRQQILEKCQIDRDQQNNMIALSPAKDCRLNCC